jgi:hypothetical protein
MKTVKTYMVRKPSDIGEVIQMSQTIVRDCPFKVEEVMISETINLTKTQYKKICERPLDDYEFLTGKGGYDKVDDKEYRKVIELTCDGHLTLYTDPEGSSYCRYLGIKLGD